MTSEIEQDQADFVGRLSAEPYFADIGIYELRPRANLAATQIQQRIESALNCLTPKGGKGGAAVTVLMPLLQGRDPNVSAPTFDASITVRVQELPLTNMDPARGTLKSAESIALEVARLCHHFRSGGGQIWTLAQGGGIAPNLEFEPKITYDVTLTRLMPVRGRAKVGPVVISPASGPIPVGILTPSNFTLTCPTLGAAIHYTLDGSYPDPSNSLYTAPFAPPVRVSGAGTAAVDADYFAIGTANGGPLLRTADGQHELRYSIPLSSWFLRALTPFLQLYRGTGGTPAGPHTCTAWVPVSGLAPGPSLTLFAFTLRAAATLAGSQQSDVTTAHYTTP